MFGDLVGTVIWHVAHLQPGVRRGIKIDVVVAHAIADHRSARRHRPRRVRAKGRELHESDMRPGHGLGHV